MSGESDGVAETGQAVDAAQPSAAARLAHSPVVAFALVALLCVIWGSTWLVIKFGLDDLPTFTGAAARFSFAALVMGLLAPCLRRLEGGDAPSLALSMSAGFGQFSIAYGIVYWAEARLPSGLVSVIWAVFPLMLAAISHLTLPGERLTRRQWLGFVFAFAGIVTLFSTDVRQVGPDALPAGIVLLGSPLICAVSTIYIKRHGAGVSSVLLNRNGMAIGAAGLVVTAILLEKDEPAVWSQGAILSVLYLALFGTCLAFGVYLWLMRWVPAYQLSLIAYVSPMFALLLGTGVRGEPFDGETLVGSGCILAGVFVAGMRRLRLPRRSGTVAVDAGE